MDVAEKSIFVTSYPLKLTNQTKSFRPRLKVQVHPGSLKSQTRSSEKHGVKSLLVFAFLIANGASAQISMDRSYQDSRERDFALQTYGTGRPAELFRFKEFLKAKKSLPPSKQRIADMIPLLPAEMRRNVLVFFRSDSLQNATCKNPRLVLFNEDASFAVSFNGESSQTGFEAMETMEFDYSEARFILREESFEKDRADRIKFLIAQKMSIKDNKLISPTEKVSLLKEKDDEISVVRHGLGRKGENPSVCLTCHKSDPTGNMTEYPKWKDTLGENDDMVFSNEDFRGDSRGDRKRDSKAHQDCIQEFLKSYKQNDRYKHIDVPGVIAPKTQEGRSTNNAKYTFLLYLLNFKRTVRMLNDHPEGPRIKALLLYDSEKCTPSPKDLLSINTNGFDKESALSHPQKYKDYLKSLDFDVMQIFPVLFPDPKQGLRSPSPEETSFRNALVNSDEEINKFYNRQKRALISGEDRLTSKFNRDEPRGLCHHLRERLLAPKSSPQEQHQRSITRPIPGIF